MASLYYDLNPTIDGIDVDRLSMPNSPTMPSRAVKGMPGPGSDDGDGGGRGGGSIGGGDNGLGSLADELAALDFDSDEEEEEEEEEEEGEGEYEEGQEGRVGGYDGTGRIDGEDIPESVGEGGEDGGESQEDSDKVDSDLNTPGDSGIITTNGRPRSNTATSATNGHSRTKSKASTLSSPKSPRTKRRSAQTKHNSIGSLSATLQNAMDSGDEEDYIEEYENGVSPSLQHRLDQIEKLATAGKQMKFGRSGWAQSRSGGGGAGGYSGFSRGGHGRLPSLPRIQGDESDEVDVDDDVIPRLMDGLQKLQPQSTMETGVSRLVTVNSALSNHIYNQTRTLRDLSLSLHPSNIASNLDEESADDDDDDDDSSDSSHPKSRKKPKLADLVISLIDIIPRPAEVALYELHVLQETTTQLIAQLSFLSDSLHMARQSTIVAGRKLRVAKEACAEWKGQLDAAEKGERWIEEGDWVGKCSRREAAKVCQDVLRGFESTCGGMDKQMESWIVE